MKLRIRNVAKIEEADLELNGITIIAGNNNTGKSTIGKIVFSLFNSLVTLEEKIVKQKRDLIYQVLKRKMEDISMQSDGYFGSASRFHNRMIRYAEELAILDSEEEKQQILKEFAGMLKDKKTNEDETLEDINGEIDRIRHLPIERLTKSVVSAYFNRIFYSEINNIYQPSASAAIDAVIGNKTISIIFSNNNCTELRQQVNILNEAVYLDNPFVLDSLNTILIRTDETERNTIKKLQRKSDVVEDIVQLELIEDKVQEVLQKINQISSGTLLMDESHSYYYKEREIGERLNINNLSTGLKSFVIIKTLLENGSLKQKDVLILDEPEIHLHPDWQLRYAEIIVLLQKVFELTIILTTHSPHFVEALQYYAEKYERDDKCTYYLSEISESGCRFKNVTEDPAEMLSQLVDASIALDKLKFQMEDTKDE